MRGSRWLGQQVSGAIGLVALTASFAAGPQTGGRENAAPPQATALPPQAVRVLPADELLASMPQSDYFAETRRNLKWIMLGRQKWLNYSFFNKNTSALKPDWPISIIFYGNATVEKVKDIYTRRRGLATNKHSLFDEGAGPVWDSDRGAKIRVPFDGPDGPDRDLLHVRAFAPPAGYFEAEAPWGRYVIATVHFDLNPPFDNVCGCSEDAERLALEMAERRGHQVIYHGVNLFNAETFRVRKRHYLQSDGYAGLVRVR
ncbi:MAG TPA: hypothetical protein DIW61_00525 [Candidatus Aminicenantes bacterium]|nr:hypothetical protein [Candidatus Aminicenantes bacterium]